VYGGSVVGYVPLLRCNDNNLIEAGVAYQSDSVNINQRRKANMKNIDEKASMAAWRRRVWRWHQKVA